jgi:phosphoglycolate phosphatase
MVSTLLGTWQFDYVLGAQPSIPQKPDPAGALLISHELGINAEEFIYLGDSSIDMRTAVNTNMYSVGALWGFQTADEILAAGAQKLIRRPLELLAILYGH